MPRASIPACRTAISRPRALHVTPANAAYAASLRHEAERLELHFAIIIIIIITITIIIITIIIIIIIIVIVKHDGRAP